MPAAHDAAQRAIEEQAILRLSAEDQQCIAEALSSHQPRTQHWTRQSVCIWRMLRFGEALTASLSQRARCLDWLDRQRPGLPRGRARQHGAVWRPISRVAKAQIGAYAICADAIDEDATVFYLKHQFQPLLSRPQTLFLPMKTAQHLVST